MGEKEMKHKVLKGLIAGVYMFGMGGMAGADTIIDCDFISGIP